MLQVPLTPELERTLTVIAARTGVAPGDLARAALVRYLADLEDYAVAVEAWREYDPAQAISLERMKRDLGLAD